MVVSGKSILRDINLMVGIKIVKMSNSTSTFLAIQYAWSCDDEIVAINALHHHSSVVTLDIIVTWIL